MHASFLNIPVALRSLRRAPGFAATAILALGLGIGLSVAVFTVADALFLRPLPVREQDRIVVLWGETRDRSFSHAPLSLTDAREFASRSRSLEGVAFATYEGAWPTPIVDGDQLSRFRRALVSGAFFEVLGVRPELGRTLRPADDVVGAAPVTVLSHAAWQHRFGGDRSILGRRLQLHDLGITYTVVGVMPQGLDYPHGVEFWLPVVSTTTRAGWTSTYVDVDVLGRLRPGATPLTARDELSSYFGGAARSYLHEMHGVVHTLPQVMFGDLTPAIVVFGAAAGLLLLISCINVANLLLVRGIARRREMAVRSALGARRARIIGQLLTENALLGIAGGALGVAIAWVAVRSFVAFAPASTPRLDGVQANGTALAAALGITIASVLLFGLAPAMASARADLQALLRSGNRQSAARGPRLARESLVVGQVALGVLVLAAAGVIARSLVKLERVDLSFEPSHLLIGELALRQDQYNSAAKQLAVLDKVLDRLQATPGVRAISPVVAVPFSGTGGWDGRMGPEGETAEQAASFPAVNLEVVTPAYFSTFGIPILTGRGFTDSDRVGAPPVVVVSQSTARHFWPGEDPIGKRVVMGPASKVRFTVVGVVADTRYRDLRDARAGVYFPLKQSFFPFAPTTLAIRTIGAPEALVPTVRRVIAESAPGVALANAEPFASYLAGPLAQPRLNAFLLLLFAGAAVALSAVGLFGVMATMVRQRTHEFGVRMALGATAHDLRRMVMRRGMVLASLGTVLGLAGAMLASQLLTSMLYEVSPTDSATLAAVAALLLVVAAVATLVPARASTRIDPAIALRSDG